VEVEPSLNDAVGAFHQLGWNGQAECVGRLAVDHELVFREHFDRRVRELGALEDLVLEWQEIGGPPVITPDTSGYGTSTIRDLIPYEFGGKVDLVFALEGVRCRLKLPTEWLSEGGDPGSEVIADAAAK
jgi:two-component sensor histidine kinase